MNPYPHICSWVFNRPWAILPETFAVITGLLRSRMRGERLSDDEIEQRIGERRKEAEPRQHESCGPQTDSRAGSPCHAQGKRITAVKGKVTVIPVVGVMGYRMNAFDDISGGVSTQRLGKWFDEAVRDSGVGAIVFDLDSPGGTVDGLQELSDKVFAARGAKPIYAVANAMAASAGYYLASAADQVMVTPSGSVGSIGTIAEHFDWSRALDEAGITPTLITSVPYKAEGNPFEPLEGEARDELQRIVNAYGDQFERDVARNRGVPASQVKKSFGQGRMFMAAEAVDRGLADRVMTLSELLGKLGVPGNAERGGSTARNAEHAAPHPGSLRRRLDLREREFSGPT